MSALPAGIRSIMSKPRYSGAKWSLLVTDLGTGQTRYQLDPDQLSLTGSTRKLFSIGAALNAFGPDHRQTTPVYRVGTVGANDALAGNLVLVGAGDLAFGGRRVDANTLQYTDFDHNDANGLETAVLTPQDPLYALDDLAKQVKGSGITAVNGNVAVDDRLFQPYRVPNGNLLITPMMVNDNQADVIITPGQAGGPAAMTYRPQTASLKVTSTVTTGAPGSTNTVTLSDNGVSTCIGRANCTQTISGSIPADYQAPFTKAPKMVRTFRVDNPDAFARAAFIEALQRNGVTVSAAPVGTNPRSLFPTGSTYPAADQAKHVSAPYLQTARLVLKVSMNLGANLGSNVLGLDAGQRTIAGSLATERKLLTTTYGVDGKAFTFPTNGSGTPDGQATPRALVQLLTAMATSKTATQFWAALPILGVDGSLTHTGTNLPAKGHVSAKAGTTVLPGADGTTIELKAQNLAGYITTRSGHQLAYALMVNDVGTITDIAGDVGGVLDDEAAISNVLYETL